MAYSYRWQYCDMDFLRHCLKKYSLLLEKIPSVHLTAHTGIYDRVPVHQLNRARCQRLRQLIHSC